jgi:hypothetical protein
VNWLSNPLIASEAPDNFHAIVLDALDAKDKRESRIENLCVAVKDADGVLRSLYQRVDGTAVTAGLDEALDRWDSWSAQFKDLRVSEDTQALDVGDRGGDEEQPSSAPLEDPTAMTRMRAPTVNQFERPTARRSAGSE